ncbi:MAG TPA: hypothetical protein VH796_08315 [Nitrososphaeraceae archaeon]|jgi:hypothetical protein
MNDSASVQCLSIAPGLKNLLEQSGLFTVKSVASLSQGEIANLLGIDTYVAGIIFQSAKKSLRDSKNNITTTKAATMVSTIR